MQLFRKSDPKKLFFMPAVAASLALAAFFQFQQGTAAGKKAELKVESTTQGKDWNMLLKVEPKSGYQITTENAPWSLSVKSNGVELAKQKWTSDEVKTSLPALKIKGTLENPEKAGSIDYTLVTFVCTKDKTQCFREVHKESVAIPAKPKA